jgi:hypothetical protein
MQELRVDTAALQAMATRWGVSADELTTAQTQTMLSTSTQPSAAAVNAAHADVEFFTAELAIRVDARATHVVDANTRYVAGEAQSADELSAALATSTIV